MDKLTRLVGAGSDKTEWWTRPFTLVNWVEISFIAKLQGWSTAKRVRSSPVAVGCNEQIEVATSKETILKRSKRASQLPALHPPMQAFIGGVSINIIG